MKLFAKKLFFSLNIKAFLCVCAWALLMVVPVVLLLALYFAPAAEFVALSGACSAPRPESKTEKETIQEHVSLNSDTRIDLSVNIKHFTKNNMRSKSSLRAASTPSLLLCVWVRWSECPGGWEREMRNRTSIYLCKHKHPPSAHSK